MEADDTLLKCSMTGKTTTLGELRKGEFVLVDPVAGHSDPMVANGRSHAGMNQNRMWNMGATDPASIRSSSQDQHRHGPASFLHMPVRVTQTAEHEGRGGRRTT